MLNSVVCICSTQMAWSVLSFPRPLPNTLSSSAWEWTKPVEQLVILGTVVHVCACKPVVTVQVLPLKYKILCFFPSGFLTLVNRKEVLNLINSQN